LRQLDDGPELFVLKPDIALERPGEGIEAILDTKWKLLDEADKKLGISQADLYQMTSYAVRYGCNRVGLIYPATAGFVDPVAYEVQNSPIVISVYFVDLVASVMDPNWAGWANMVAHGVTK
jgi:5-methylcytosine-specific restriction enzyme subunit McrC